MEEQGARVDERCQKMLAGFDRLINLVEQLQKAVCGKEPASSPSSSSANTHVMVVSEVDSAEPRPPSFESNSDQSSCVNPFQNCDSESDQKSGSNYSQNSDSESDQKSGSNHSQSSESEFSEFAYFQQQYENENLSQQELEDLWEQFKSHRIHESDEHESEFSEFANFQQQYENENLSHQELEDLWEQFNSHRIHESEEIFSSSEQQEEQENELENYSNADENESLDPGGCQSPFSEASDISADY